MSGRAQGFMNTSGTRKSGSTVLGQFGGWLHNKLPRCQCNAVLVLANDPRRVEKARPFSENWKLGLCKTKDARSKDSRTGHCSSVQRLASKVVRIAQLVGQNYPPSDHTSQRSSTKTLGISANHQGNHSLYLQGLTAHRCLDKRLWPYQRLNAQSHYF